MKVLRTLKAGSPTNWRKIMSLLKRPAFATLLALGRGLGLTTPSLSVTSFLKLRVIEKCVE